MSTHACTYLITVVEDPIFVTSYMTSLIELFTNERTLSFPDELEDLVLRKPRTERSLMFRDASIELESRYLEYHETNLIRQLSYVNVNPKRS